MLQDHKIDPKEIKQKAFGWKASVVVLCSLVLLSHMINQ